MRANRSGGRSNDVGERRPSAVAREPLAFAAEYCSSLRRASSHVS